MAKKKKLKSTDPTTTVEIVLPPALWQQYLELKEADKTGVLLDNVIRAVFDYDARFGMSYVKFSEAKSTKSGAAKSGKDDDEHFYKLCEGD